MVRNLLVPLDGSTFGEHALPVALRLAEQRGATVHLVHAHEPLQLTYTDVPFYLDDELEKHLKERLHGYLESVVKRAAAVSPARVTFTLLEGEAADTLRSAAESTGADLVVMTTHARGPFGRAWLGSVADRLVRELSMPLLLVHPAEESPDLAAPWRLEHVLIPLDGSALAEEMVERAVDLGGGAAARYTLLRVVQPVTPVHLSLPWDEPATQTEGRSLLHRTEKLHDQLRAEAEAYLEGIAAKLRERGLEVRTEVVFERQPAVAILRAAQHDEANLIALETHGRRGLARLFVGSVADKVVRGTTLPVLVHRPVYE